MTFRESIESFVYNSNWKNLIDENFGRNSGVYSYLIYTETKIIIDKLHISLPNKIVFKSDFQRFRMKSSKESNIEYRGKKYKLLEKQQIIPFGTFERKYKFSGSISQILNDLLKETVELECRFSNKLLETGNYPLFGIDSNIKYPSYLVELRNLVKLKTKPYNFNGFSFENEEQKGAIKDILGYVGIYYELNDIINKSTFIIFPLPYVRIAENRLDTKGENEKVNLTLDFNKDFYNVLKSSKIEIQYEITELNGDKKEDSKILIEFNGKRLVEVSICPKTLNKIGLCNFKILINNIEVNQFRGTYLRGFTINTKIIENE